MDDVINLVNHLINAKYSIDSIETIKQKLNISHEQILRISRADRYAQYFQLIHNRNQHLDRIALTLDLFCCTHYGNQCKNALCPFLHLCPYNIRPQHGKCTNKTCPYDHEVLKSRHNKTIINVRGLSFFSEETLLGLARVSADPSRSFWVCTDHGKKTGCPEKSRCEKLHYCYFSLTNACTKPFCQHVINDACIAYFKRKELGEQHYDDVLEAFKKVLRQRKPDFINTINVPPHPSWTTVTNLKKTTIDQPRDEVETISACSNLSPMAPEYKSFNPAKCESAMALPEENTDIYLCDSMLHDDYIDTEYRLTKEIGFPIRLLICKIVSSRHKQFQRFTDEIDPVYWYCPLDPSDDICKILLCQNQEQHLLKPLVVYSNIRDAHDATGLNVENNQFSLLRLCIYGKSLTKENFFEISDPSRIHFDQMWIYTYDDI